MLAGVVLAVGAGAADAYTCYVALDAKDSVVYRDMIPPVDLSEQGKAARDAFRQRGNYLLIVEIDHCLPLGSALGSVGASPATPEDYVSGLRPVMTTSRGAGVAARPAFAGPSSMPPSAPVPAPAAPPAAGRRPSRGAY
jgi:hypothetical protein